MIWINMQHARLHGLPLREEITRRLVFLQRHFGNMDESFDARFDARKRAIR